MKKLLFSVFVATLLSSFSFALAAGVDVSIQNQLTGYTSETLTTDVTIKNNQPFSDTFSLSLFPPQFDKVSANLDTFLVEIAANSERTVKAYFTVAIDAEPVGRSYTVTTTSTSNSSVTETENVIFNVVRRANVYVRDISVSSYEINPEEEVQFTSEVFNLEDKVAIGYFLKTTVRKGDGIVQTFQETIDGLPPKTPRQVTNSVKINKYAPPGSYAIESELRDATNKVVHSKTVHFAVRTITAAPTEYTQKETNYNVLSSVITIKVKNEGNIGLQPFSLTESVPGFASVLFDPEIEPSASESSSGRVVYSWSVPALGPGEQFTLAYRLALWRLWLVLGLLGGAGTLAYKWFATPQVVKGTRHIGKIARGKEILILLEIKNKSLHDMKDVEVVDVVPQIARVVESFETLKPKMSKTGHGTVLRWLLGTMKPREERVITYKLKSLVDVAGHMNLPAAEILYTDRGQNRVNVVSKQALVKAS